MQTFLLWALAFYLYIFALVVLGRICARVTDNIHEWRFLYYSLVICVNVVVVSAVFVP